MATVNEIKLAAYEFFRKEIDISKCDSIPLLGLSFFLQRPDMRHRNYHFGTKAFFAGVWAAFSGIPPEQIKWNGKEASLLNSIYWGGRIHGGAIEYRQEVYGETYKQAENCGEDWGDECRKPSINKTRRASAKTD